MLGLILGPMLLIRSLVVVIVLNVACRRVGGTISCYVTREV